MLFRRRSKPHLWERIRVALWPRRTWARSMRYIAKRVLRLSATPHAIAAGFAGGALASMTPFVGFHFLLGALIAYVTGGNLLASALGTAIGNPFTFPFIWAGTYRLGRWILGLGDRVEPPIDMAGGLLEHSFDKLIPVLKPMLVGAVPTGIIVWFTLYIIVRSGVRTYQQTRRRRFAERNAARRSAIGASNPGE